MTGKPGKQRATVAALKQLEAWAIVRDILPRPITTGVEAEESDGGHTPWSDHHVELVEKHGREDFRRMVILGANTGQRGSDLVRMGWSDIETYKGPRDQRQAEEDRPRGMDADHEASCRRDGDMGAAAGAVPAEARRRHMDP